MRFQGDTVLPTRRRLLAWTAGVACCARAYALASDFWNKKDPSDWSSVEAHQLLTKSPWAKQVTVYAPAGGGERSSGAGGRVGATLSSTDAQYGDGTGPGGWRQEKGPRDLASDRADDVVTSTGSRRGAGRQFKGIVRWESAKPVLNATKVALPDQFANHYVISVSGFPFGDIINVSGHAQFSNSAMEHIMTASSLTPKGKRMAMARVAQVVVGALQLGFPKESIQISRDDEEVAFVTIINRMTIRARFSPKEMMHHGVLSV